MGEEHFARRAFRGELEDLGLQLEIVFVRVEQALTGSWEALSRGDADLGREIVKGDDDIDALVVSLTERSYELLSRQAPVASDLRFIISVLRILAELERIGDLCLRVAKLAGDHHLIASEPTFSVLEEMFGEALFMYRGVMRAWESGDLRGAMNVVRRDDVIDSYLARLTRSILDLKGPQAVPVAVSTLLGGRALERIADHVVLIAERVRYVLTGSPEAITREVRS